MARTLWKGSLNFGLVNVPVGLYPATQDRSIHLHQLEAGTSDRIRYKKVNERTGDEVEAHKIVKGAEVEDGQYVIITDEELEAAEPDKSRMIEISDFVALEEIDPVFYRSTYYLAPQGEAANKAYSLLRQVMLDARRVAIGTLVMRNKEYPVAIRPADEVLILETMYFADEIRSPSDELIDLPAAVELSKRERDMARLLLDSMESEWDPTRYHDTHRAKVEELIEAKQAGDDVLVGASSAPSGTKVVDLMEVLNASIESVNGGRTPTSPAKRTRKSPATRTRKSPATRASGNKSAAAKRAAPTRSGAAARSRRKAS